MDNEQVNKYLRSISQGILDVQQMLIDAPDSFHDRVDTLKLEKILLEARRTVSAMYKLGRGPKETG